MGTTWKVKTNNTKVNKAKAYGLCVFAEREILLSTKWNKLPVARDITEATFYHELVHAMLEMIGRDDLNQDEQFVDNMGNLLHQFDKTRQ